MSSFKWETCEGLHGDIPPPLSSHSACLIDDKIYVFGGMGAKFLRSNSVYVIQLATKHIVKYEYYKPPAFHQSYSTANTSDPSSKPGNGLFAKFKKRKSVVEDAPLPRERHAVCTINLGDTPMMVVFGGIGDNKNRLNDLWFLNTRTMTWTEAKNVSGVPPSRRYNHTMCAINDKTMIIYGGYDGDYKNDVYLLEVRSDYSASWKYISCAQPEESIPEPRYHHSAITLGDKMLVIGGKNCHRQLNDVWMFDTEAYYWTKFDAVPADKMNVSNYPFSPKHGQEICIIGTHLIMIGGVTGKQYDIDVHVCDLQKMVWTTHQLPDSPPGRVSHSMCNISGTSDLLVFAGVIDVPKDQFVSRSNDMWILHTPFDRLSASIPFVREKRINDLVIEKLIGKGGQGSVFLCRNTVKHTYHAMKKILVPFNTQQGPDRILANDMSAFNEILVHQALSLDHENVLKTEKFFMEQTANGISLIIVMPYCELGDLEYYMKRSKKKLSERRILQLMTQIVRGVVYIHSKGVIHRDLKASNVLCTQKVGSSDAIVLKIADFGMAKNTLVSDAKTTCGTLYFCSPEIYNSEPYTLTADVWSLGIILLWMFTGRYLDLKIQSNRDQVLKSLQSSSVCSQPTVYEQLIFSMTNFDPQSRISSQEVLDKLEQLISQTTGDGDSFSCSTTTDTVPVEETVMDISDESTTELHNHMFHPDSLISDPSTANTEFNIMQHHDEQLITNDSSEHGLSLALTSTPEPPEPLQSTTTHHSDPIWIQILSEIMKLEEQSLISFEEAEELTLLSMKNDEHLRRVYLAIHNCNSDNTTQLLIHNLQRLLRLHQRCQFE